MKRSTTRLAMLALTSAALLAACSGSPVASPTSSPAAVAGTDDGTVTAAGYGPGGGAAIPGTCDQDCTGAGGSNGPGTGYGPGDGTGYGPGNGPADGTGYGPGGDLCGTACTGTVAVGPADLPVVLAAAVQEEFKAEMLYRSVIQHQGELPPFSLIVQAEAQHVAALQLLFTRRGWTAPASAWTPEQFPQFATLADACAAGATAEREDAEFYTPHLQRTDLPADVRTVLTNLQAASLQNHLPAFERCR